MVNQIIFGSEQVFGPPHFIVKIFKSIANENFEKISNMY